MQLISDLEQDSRLDGVVAAGQRVTRLIRPGQVRDALHGVWLGHPVHPMLTQASVGAWLSATIMDLTGGDQKAARRLVAAGLTAAIPAALAEFERTEQALAWLEPPQRLFRPYGGRGALGPHLLHPAVVDKLLHGGYTCVLWNSVPGDWQHPDEWVTRAIADCLSRAWSLVVLHDLPTGAMAHLDGFIRRLKDEGVELTQEYPPDCVPIAGGRIVLPIAQYVQSGIRI